jgi:hypothetical protein
VRTYSQLCEGDLLRKWIIELHEAAKTSEQTADTLNAEGNAPINPEKKFNREIVRKLQLKLGIHGERDDVSLLGPGEWWVRDLAEEVGMPWQTLREWAVNGWVQHGRRTSKNCGSCGPTVPRSSVCAGSATQSRGEFLASQRS